MTEMILELNNITKRYESVAGVASKPVLNDITLNVNQGEMLAIVGPSGSGKSTLLNIIGTLDKPTSGNVIFKNHDITQLDENELAALRNQGIGFIFQSHHLLPQCTVLENVLVPTLVSPKQNQANNNESRARRLLERVGLGERLSHRPGQLSGGECQRVAVVRSLINEPSLLLADEPTGSLDHATAETLTNLLIELNHEEKVAMIMVTHAKELASQMEKRFELRDGQLVEQ